MSDDTTATAGELTDETTDDTFASPASQEELDRIIQARLDRERKKFADYDELKKAAEKLSKLEEANKTEAEKAAARAEAAEKRAAELEAKALRAEVAASKGVPVALLTGGTQEELEAAADALIAFRGEQKTAGPSSTSLSRVNQNVVKGSTGDQFADFFTNQLSS
jgi:ATPase subunit of ABC transporter with duplicated ATPase domains